MGDEKGGEGSGAKAKKNLPGALRQTPGAGGRGARAWRGRRGPWRRRRRGRGSHGDVGRPGLGKRRPWRVGRQEGSVRGSEVRVMVKSFIDESQ